MLPSRFPARLARPLRGRAATAVAAAFMLPGAMAQPLEEVVVSASRTEQNRFDAPAAVQAVGAQAVQEAGPQVNLSESLNRIPGVVVLNRQNYAQDLQLSIRGIGSRATFGIRGVRLLVDGIPASMPDGQGQASTISLTSVERIEVLRGPLAQLYGNAAGGVVQAFTRDAPAVPEANASIFAGSFGTLRSNVQLAGRAGGTGLVVDYGTFETDGYRRHAEAERRHLNAKVTTDLAGWRVDLIANVFRQPVGEDPGGLTRAQFQADPRQVVPQVLQFNARKTVEQDQLGVVAQRRVGDGRLLLRAYGGQRDVWQALAFANNGIVSLDREYSGLGAQYSVDRRIGSTRLTLSAGAEHERQRENRRGFDNVAGAQGTLRRLERNDIEQTGVYAQADWRVLPSISLVGGVRTTRVSFRSRDQFLADGDNGGAISYSATNPVAGITWHASDTLNVYANIGRGFETPTAAEIAYRPGLAANTVVDGLNFGLRAARSTHAELGVKWLPTPSQRLEAALFSIDTDGELVPFSTAGRATFQNAGRTRRQGAELSWTARLADTVQALAAVTVLDAEFRDGYTRVGGAGRVAAGNAIPGTPERFAYAELAWRPQGASAAAAVPPAVGGAAGAFGRQGGTHVALEVLHVGRIFANDLNTEQAAAYTLVNLRAGLEQRLGDWRLRQFVRLDNVADKRFAGSVIVNDANGRFFEPGPGRTWLVGLSLGRAFR